MRIIKKNQYLTSETIPHWNFQFDSHQRYNEKCKILEYASSLMTTTSQFVPPTLIELTVFSTKY